ICAILPANRYAIDDLRADSPEIARLAAQDASGGADGRRALEAQLLHRDLAHLDLADLAGDRHRVAVDELPVAGDLEGRDLALAEVRQLLASRRGTLAELDPGHHLLAVALGGDADHLHVRDV